MAKKAGKVVKETKASKKPVKKVEVKKTSKVVGKEKAEKTLKVVPIASKPESSKKKAVTKEVKAENSKKAVKEAPKKVKPAKEEKPVKPNKVEKLEKPERLEKIEKNDKAGKPEKAKEPENNKKAKSKSEESSTSDARPKTFKEALSQPLVSAEEPNAEQKVETDRISVEDLTKKPSKKYQADTDEESKWLELKDKYKTLRPQPYRMTEVYRDRTVLDHKVLGIGFILSVVNDRLEVLFQSGTKQLISNYKR